MTRSGYVDDLDPLDLGRWRGQVMSAIRGERGQALLRDLLIALDAMPNKRLIRAELEEQGEVCALGCLLRSRGIPTEILDPEDFDSIASAVGAAPQLVREIESLNDDWGPSETPEARWVRMRAWVAKQIKEVQP